jgi:hypothetical protein
VNVGSRRLADSRVRRLPGVIPEREANWHAAQRLIRFVGELERDGVRTGEARLDAGTMTQSSTSAPAFPDDGILWRGFNDDTLRIIAERPNPVLLFVRDTDPRVWPFLREIFKTLPKNETLRDLLHARCVALYAEVETLPEEQKQLGAGRRYHIAILSPFGLTPLIMVDPTEGAPAEIVERIAALLLGIVESWG